MESNFVRLHSMQNTREPGGAATRSNVRERAIEIGLAILDEEGADALTLKRIAEVIGVRPPALHWHFRDRHALMEKILESALRNVNCDDIGRSWDVQFVRLAEAVFHRMPPVATIAGALGSGPISSWIGMPRVSALLSEVLQRSDLDETAQIDVHDATLAIIVGSGLGAVGQARSSDRAIDASRVATAVKLVLAGAQTRLPAAR
jgi:AcrR family transcriptional regulator